MSVIRRRFTKKNFNRGLFQVHCVIRRQIYGFTIIPSQIKFISTPEFASGNMIALILKVPLETGKKLLLIFSAAYLPVDFLFLAVMLIKSECVLKLYSSN